MWYDLIFILPRPSSFFGYRVWKSMFPIQYLGSSFIMFSTNLISSVIVSHGNLILTIIIVSMLPRSCRTNRSYSCYQGITALVQIGAGMAVAAYMLVFLSHYPHSRSLDKRQNHRRIYRRYL